MSTIMPQSIVNAPVAPMIVIRTVHGDAIAVPMDMLNRARNAHLSGDMPKTESAQTIRSVREAG